MIESEVQVHGAYDERCIAVDRFEHAGRERAVEREAFAQPAFVGQLGGRRLVVALPGHDARAAQASCERAVGGERGDGR